jgi:hypothetical protein
MVFQYAWKEGSRFTANAEMVASEIESIGDGATPEQIVAKAQNKRTALHQCFDWDDDEAAKKWRLQQARQVVNSIVVYEQPEEEQPPQYISRAFENVTVGGGRAYVPIKAAMDNDAWREEVFGQITAAIFAQERKAESYEHMFPELKDLRGRLKAARETINL